MNAHKHRDLGPNPPLNTDAQTAALRLLFARRLAA
jgi:hypothetical protein